MQRPASTIQRPPPVVPPSTRASIRRNLLGWYDRNRRDLPWRGRASDPYAQWVAEIMLQQTRVETVLPYYERFMGRFPDVATLARARHETVLKHWQGLGYYRRALNLHTAARELKGRRFHVPSEIEALRQLPGVGEYVAAAIASIAFGQRHAAVDGNVARVLARLFAVPDDVRSAAGRRRIRQLARELVPRSRPGDFNQAWMDLGSAICTPRDPRCDLCPLRSRCAAAKRGETQALPLRTARSASVPTVHVLTAVFRRDGCVLMRRRPRGGLWSGLWETPTLMHERQRATEEPLRELARSSGVSLLGTPRSCGTVHHRLTHRAYSFAVFACRVRACSDEDAHRWARDDVLRALPVSAAHRKILERERAALNRDG